jgi:hypothetical protein
LPSQQAKSKVDCILEKAGKSNAPDEAQIRQFTFLSGINSVLARHFLNVAYFEGMIKQNLRQFNWIENLEDEQFGIVSASAIVINFLP